MILGDADIMQFVQDGTIIIKPFSTRQVNPNSYDLRIGDKLKTYEDQGRELDCREVNQTDIHFIDEYGFVLLPNKLYLANTMERVGLKPKNGHNLCATLMGKSSLGRLGLDVHISAGFIDTGFEGDLVLELRVVEPLRIYANMPIAQIKFEMSTPVVQPYGDKRTSKYQNQAGIVASKMYQNF